MFKGLNDIVFLTEDVNSVMCLCLFTTVTEALKTYNLPQSNSDNHRMCWVNTADSWVYYVLFDYNKLNGCVSPLFRLMAPSWMDASSCKSYLFALSWPALHPPLTLGSDSTLQILDNVTHGFRLEYKMSSIRHLSLIFCPSCQIFWTKVTLRWKRKTINT